jgi:acyl-CoA synthetase (AMP-forming)/AMP-acid ligase II
MLPNSQTSLRASILAAGNLSACIDMGAGARRSWGELTSASAFAVRRSELRGSSVLVATTGQLDAAQALIQLDGVARRMVLYPPDLSRGHLDFVARCAEADWIVTDDPGRESSHCRIACILPRGERRRDPRRDRGQTIETEWILLTSGTTGLPKLVKHTLASLTAAIAPRKSSSAPGNPSSRPMVWSTLYDIRRYGGLQILLRAALTGTPLVLAGAQESTADFLLRAGGCGMTHISGTPSQWRRVLMSPSVHTIAPMYLRLSGEIADQAILNQLQSQYPEASMVHAFASTEAGVVLEVKDGAMGIPADAIGQTPSVEMKVKDGTLRVRSSRTASAYLGQDRLPLRDAEGFVDTGDVLELREGRYYFAGRRDGTINVGGLKVHPEEVEAVINRHPEVGMSLVRSRKSSITGRLVVADVVLKRPEPPEGGTQALQSEILQFCRAELALYKVPVGINFVPTLAVSQTGKLIRHHA